MRTVINTEHAPAVPPHVPLVQGLRIGNLLQVAGQVGQDPQTGQLVPGGLTAQTERALQNVLAVLEAGGAGIGDVLMMRVYLTSVDAFPDFNAAYRRVIGDEPPPRTTICVDLPGGFLVEVDALAAL